MKYVSLFMAVLSLTAAVWITVLAGYDFRDGKVGGGIIDLTLMVFNLFFAWMNFGSYKLIKASEHGRYNNR